MMRLRFTAADLRRITFAPAPNALLETALSVRRPPGMRWSRPDVREWRRSVDGTVKARAGVLLDVVPEQGFLPDFLLQPDAGDLSEGVELARRTPAGSLAADLDRLPRAGGSWRRGLAEGESAAWQTLTDDLYGYFSSSLALWWPRVCDTAAADRALRAETLLRGGTDALLATLIAHCRWDPPVLHVRAVGEYDVELCGRGLLLVPSYFAPGPLLMYRPGDSTVLVYPMYSGDRPATATDALGPLLGRTRAAVLAALRHPATTSALADRLAISRASASEHATVLRNAGLISTTRLGGAVLHALTPLGSALLAGDSANR
ncbi:helix-turn-helix transcriptional regulator [Microbispora sp. GKU 823]|uniref:ArsR/SmtB family transcription factor n=1 Tax=Microbispora sp. GKU 823 TaxID=1652100 RepID=UPI0009A3A4A7|nr:winged helix-turn-helix domain-containing protein [Microbispora sp. GKU 823]OPG01802.1 transcriptional regulator [Microbispora sp. GKU 823]